MRDQTIIDMTADVRETNEHNSRILAKQFGQLNARMAAMQEMLFDSHFSLLKIAFLQLLSPGLVYKLLQKTERRVIGEIAKYAKEMNEKMKAAFEADQKKIKVISKEQGESLIKVHR